MLNPQSFQMGESMRIVDKTNKMDIRSQDKILRAMYNTKKKELSEKVAKFMDKLYNIAVENKAKVDAKRTR